MPGCRGAPAVPQHAPAACPGRARGLPHAPRERPRGRPAPRGRSRAAGLHRGDQWAALADDAPGSASMRSPPALVTRTMRAGSRSRAVSRTQPTSGRPSTGCSTFGSVLLMRVPLPAARTMTVSWTRGAGVGAAARSAAERARKRPSRIASFEALRGSRPRPGRRGTTGPARLRPEGRRTCGSPGPPERRERPPCPRARTGGLAVAADRPRRSPPGPGPCDPGEEADQPQAIGVSKRSHAKGPSRGHPPARRPAAPPPRGAGP